MKKIANRLNWRGRKLRRRPKWRRLKELTLQKRQEIAELSFIFPWKGTYALWWGKVCCKAPRWMTVQIDPWKTSKKVFRSLVFMQFFQGLADLTHKKAWLCVLDGTLLNPVGHGRQNLNILRENWNLSGKKLWFVDWTCTGSLTQWSGW